MYQGLIQIKHQSLLVYPITIQWILRYSSRLGKYTLRSSIICWGVCFIVFANWIAFTNILIIYHLDRLHNMLTRLLHCLSYIIRHERLYHRRYIELEHCTLLYQLLQFKLINTLLAVRLTTLLYFCISYEAFLVKGFFYDWVVTDALALSIYI